MGASDPGEASTELASGATREEGGGAASKEVPAWLGARYRVVRRLGRGGMGEVFLAVDEALQAEVALKTLVAGPGAGSAGALARLRDEVRLAQKVTHPNVCRTYDLDEVEGNWLIKMEYVAGETLAERLKGGPLPVAEVVRIATRICAGLAAAHERGVVHRDLKPHNVMIERGTGRILLMDFGIARAAELAGSTAENVSGTPDYMAPEQVRGREVDGRADLYSLGCVLYEMLAGERPFARTTNMATALAQVNDPPPALPPHVPARVARVVAQLLEKDLARRPASATAVAAGLAGPTSRRLWIAAAAVALAAAVVAVVLLRPRARWQPHITTLRTYEENSDAPTFSPDGKLIAYTSDREERGRFRAYVEPLDGGRARAVTPREMALDTHVVRWTHDGLALLVIVSGRRVLRVPVAAGAAQVVAEGAGWAEDCAGRLLIVYDGSPGCARCQRLALREPDDRERDLVRAAADEALAYPHCDREGRRVLYSRSDMHVPWSFKPFDLWTVSLDGGEPRRLTTDRGYHIGAFTPGGRSVVYSGTFGGESHIWERSLEGDDPPVQITSGSGWEWVPDVAPDGRTAIYDIDNTFDQLHEQPIDGGAVRRHPAKLEGATHLHATPDGRALIGERVWFVDAPEAHVVSIPLEGGDAETLFDGRAPAVTLDGGEIVYAVPGRIMATPRAGGAGRVVTELTGLVLFLEVGPDDRVHLGVARPAGWESWSAPLAGGAAERELPAPWTALWPAPRGGWRAALELGRGFSYRVRLLPPGAEVDAAGARELTGDSWGWRPAGVWSADGRFWIYVHDAQMHRLEVDSGREVVLSPAADSSELAVSSDGRTLYAPRTSGPVWRQLITNFADRR